MNMKVITESWLGPDNERKKAISLMRLLLKVAADLHTFVTTRTTNRSND